MKVLLFLTLFTCAFNFSLQPVLAATASSDVVSAKKEKSEPAPKDKDERKGGGEIPDSREETYEGRERGDSRDDGGNDSGSGGGMMSEVFYVKPSLPRSGSNVKVEDHGLILVYTETAVEDLGASESCTTVTRTVVEKASGKVLSEETKSYCNNWPL